MIPKKIHYCWFGGKELPKSVKKCIASWKKYCPDYEIIEWNEMNFDINKFQYVKQAYDNKKWAFVSDVARLYALYNFGGIYMDTDVEVIKNLDYFLNNQTFFGFEALNRIQTGIIGSTRGNPFIGQILESYIDRKFIDNNGNFDMTPNVTLITQLLSNKNIKFNNTYQIVDNVTLYPCEFLCPLDYDTRKLKKTSNTYVIHWFDGSWVPLNVKIKDKIFLLIKKLIGTKNFEKIKNKIKGKK